MSDPALALQGALVTLLSAGAGVGVGPRVYSRVPSKPEFPYIRVGDEQVIGDDVECADLSEVITRTHVWARDVSGPPPVAADVLAKSIAGAVRTLISTSTFSLTGFTVNEVLFEQAQQFEDLDGRSQHAVVEFRFFIQHD